jgi:hypothetical protein
MAVMIIFTFDPFEGVPVRDGDADGLVTEMIVDHETGTIPNIHRVYATENIFHAMRVAIKVNRLPCTSFEVRFKDHVWSFDKDGRSRRWPKGFCDYQRNWLVKLL